MATRIMRLRLQRFFKVEADSHEEAIEKVKEEFNKDTELNDQTVKEVSEIGKEIQNSDQPN